jgi:hypothetical protein
MTSSLVSVIIRGAKYLVAIDRLSPLGVENSRGLLLVVICSCGGVK